MPYTPNPADGTNPLDAVDASTAAAEFRALKTYLAAQLASLTVLAGKSTPARQTVLTGPVTSAGSPDILIAGTGLAVNRVTSSTPYVLTYAAGFSAITGSADFFSSITCDGTQIAGSLAASNTNYITSDFLTTGTETGGSTLIAPQYGAAFDKTQNLLCNFQGTNGATTTTDDFGNTFLLTNATISTAQFKFGSSSLLFNGTTAYAQTADITTLGAGSWEVPVWFRTTSLAAYQSVLTFANAGGYGLNVGLRTTGLLEISASSNGTSYNIASAAAGATTLAINTWYRLRVVFDALAGTYRMYLSNNGALEVQDYTVSSSLKICSFTSARIGTNSAASANWFVGNMQTVGISRCATATGVVTPSVSAPTVTDQKVNWFDLNAWQMKEVTAASATAGTNPTFTARNRVFVGEADTSGAAVTAVRTYVYQSLGGQARSLGYGQTWQNLAASRAYSTTYYNLTGQPITVNTCLLYTSPSPRD